MSHAVREEKEVLREKLNVAMGALENEELSECLRGGELGGPGAIVMPEENRERMDGETFSPRFERGNWRMQLLTHA